MTTRAFYSAMGVSSYGVLKSWRKDGVFHLRLGVRAAKLQCPQCGDRNVIRRGIVDRLVRAPRSGLDRTVYFIQVPRLECRRCERVLTAALPNVVPQCNYTKSLARLVVDLRRMMTIRDIAQYLGVGEGMIRGIGKTYLQKHFSKPRLKDLKVIAIDELNVGRKKFLTIVIDVSAHRMEDNVCLSAGCPIARSVIEDACRHLVEDRMERSGIQWIHQGRQALLNLRAVHRSSCWNAFQAQFGRNI